MRWGLGTRVTRQPRARVRGGMGEEDQRGRTHGGQARCRRWTVTGRGVYRPGCRLPWVSAGHVAIHGTNGFIQIGEK